VGDAGLANGRHTENRPEDARLTVTAINPASRRFLGWLRGAGGGDAAAGGAEREFRLQAGPRSGRAIEQDPATERFHPVRQAGQAGATGEAGAAGAVVAYRDVQHAVRCVRAAARDGAAVAGPGQRTAEGDRAGAQRNLI